MAAGSSSSIKHPAAETGPKTASAWWWALGLLVLGIPFLFRSVPDAEQEALAARRQKIESMTISERERLERNFERFQQLPPERQEVLRGIEKAVSEDETLNKTLLEFERWLTTLSPWERMELRNAETVDDKLQFVSAITTARRQEAEDSLQNQKEWEEYVIRNLSRFQGQGRRPEPHRVSDNQISYMMTVLESYASDVKLTKNSLPGCAAYNIQLLTEALKANIVAVGLEQARSKPLPEETVQKMIDQITDPKSLTNVQEIFDKNGSKGFVFYLAFKLEMAWWNESRKHPPSQQELDQVAKTLGGKVQEDYERRKKSDPQGVDFHLLLATRRATFQTDAKDLSDVLEELEIRRFRPSGSSGRSNDGGGFGAENRGPGKDNDDHRGSRDDDDDRNRGDRGSRDDNDESRRKKD